MGLKSITVPQPQFSNWVIQRRRDLSLSPTEFQEKLNGKLSERTLKYLEAGKKETFSEYTLSILAQGLGLSYPDLLHQIEELKSNGRQRGGLTATSSRKIRPFVFGTAVSVTILAVALFIGYLLNKRTQLGTVLIHSDHPQIIIVLDDKGKTLWQKDLGSRVIKVEVKDLDQNGSTEIIAAIGKWNYRDWGERSGWLLVWDAKGNLLTEQNLWKSSIYPAEEPSCLIEDFQIVDLDRDGVLEIVAQIRGQEWYPSRLAVLHYEDFAFKEVNTYWHPGFLGTIVVEDIDSDSFPEIVCAAVNNDLKRVPAFHVEKNMHAVFMLQGRSIFGQAPPYLGKTEKGSQVWYRYLTPGSSSDASRIMAISVSSDRNKPILVELGDSCFFYLNYQGEVLERFEGDSCKGETKMHLIPNEKKW